MMKAKKKKPRVGKPLGSTNEYNKVRRRQGDIANQRQICFRVTSPSERDFIEEAAKAAYPKVARPVAGFCLEASVERAAQILNRSRPLPSSVPLQPSLTA